MKVEFFYHETSVAVSTEYYLLQMMEVDDCCPRQCHDVLKEVCSTAFEGCARWCSADCLALGIS